LTEFWPGPILPNTTKFWPEPTWPNMATFGLGPDQSNFGKVDSTKFVGRDRLD